jgi:hypothetical protein
MPLHYPAPAPVPWLLIPESERDKRGLLSEDLCMIDDQHFFILGNLEIPVLGSAEILCWDVWVALSEPQFRRSLELWEKPGRESEPPYFGWLNTRLPCYPETLGLKTHAHTREVGDRPAIELEATDHPLAVEQRNGITWQRVQEIAELMLHGQKK